MFLTTLKHKEVEFQARLMENRLKKLQDEEEKAMKKIQETINRTQVFEKIQESKRGHNRTLEEHRQLRQCRMEEQRAKNLEERARRQQNIENAMKYEMDKNHSIREEQEDTHREYLKVASQEYKQLFAKKKDV